MNLQRNWCCFLRLTGDLTSEFRRIFFCDPAAADSTVSFFRSISARAGGAASATTELCIVLRGPGMLHRVPSSLEHPANRAFNADCYRIAHRPAGLSMLLRVPSNPVSRLTVNLAFEFHRIASCGWAAVDSSSSLSCSIFAKAEGKSLIPLEAYISPPGRKHCFQLPTGSPTGRDFAPAQSVEASAKWRFFCGFHHGLCIHRKNLMEMGLRI